MSEVEWDYHIYNIEDYNNAKCLYIVYSHRSNFFPTRRTCRSATAKMLQSDPLLLNKRKLSLTDENLIGTSNIGFCKDRNLKRINKSTVANCVYNIQRCIRRNDVSCRGDSNSGIYSCNRRIFSVRQ